MNQDRYLLDNNVLGQLGERRRQSDFFRERCRVTVDVLFEARFTMRDGSLSEQVLPTTAADLLELRRVMASIDYEDLDLVDLFRNKGAADPMIVAKANVLNAEQSLLLYPDRWVVVSDDKAVVAKATEFGLDSLTPSELCALCDAAL